MIRQSHELMPDMAYDAIAQHLPAGHHLDYGCGQGWWTALLSRKGFTSLTGYDPNHDAKAKNPWFENNPTLHFLSERQELEDLMIGLGISGFDSATLTFVVHEHPRAVEEIITMLKPGATLAVLDYDMCGYPEEEFGKLFTAETELAVIDEVGFDYAYLEHTLVGMSSYGAWCKDSGFKRRLSGWMLRKYCYWIGELLPDSSDK